jgi:hypothetical protein
MAWIQALYTSSPVSRMQRADRGPPIAPAHSLKITEDSVMPICFRFILSVIILVFIILGLVTLTLQRETEFLCEVRDVQMIVTAARSIVPCRLGAC